MTTFNLTHFVLAVPDLKASAAFYRSALGFSVHEMAPGWLRFERGSCSIMAGECPDALPARDLGDHSYFAYVGVDGIEELYDQVVADRVEIVKSLRTEPWGMKEFGIRTNDGHRMMFGASMTS